MRIGFEKTVEDVETYQIELEQDIINENEVDSSFHIQFETKEEAQKFYKKRWAESTVPPTLVEKQEMIDAGIRPWEPFTIIDIRLDGTNKTTFVDHEGKEYGRKQVTDGNLLDSSRGCIGGATNRNHLTGKSFGCPWGCYAKEATVRFHKMFNIPVSMRLKPAKLLAQLKMLDDDFVRLGGVGDPSHDLNLSLELCKLVWIAGKIPVVVTRFWNVPDNQQLAHMQKYGVVLHGSVCSIDSERMREKILSVLERYRDMSGDSVLRLITFKFREGDPLGVIQERLTKWGQVLEQPARLQRSNPSWELVDKDAYSPYKSMLTGKENRRWWTAGILYPHLESCHTACYRCQNKCMAVSKIVPSIDFWIE